MGAITSYAKNVQQRMQVRELSAMIFMYSLPSQILLLVAQRRKRMQVRAFRTSATDRYSDISTSAYLNLLRVSR